MTKDSVGIDIGSNAIKMVITRSNEIIAKEIFPITGRPLQIIKQTLNRAMQICNTSNILLGVTGTGSKQLCQLLALPAIDESIAIVRSVNIYYPDVRTVVEIGHRDQRFLSLKKDERFSDLMIIDSSSGPPCATGGGSFFEAMAKRMDYSVEEFARLALNAKKRAKLAGRCVVFGETDVVHLFQHGTSVEDIAAGVPWSIARNFRTAVAKNKKPKGKVIFIGGMSENPAMKQALQEELKLSELIVPEHNRHLAALGAAHLASHKIQLNDALVSLETALNQPFEYEATKPITPHAKPAENLYHPVILPKIVDVAGLGIDIGSVSTKAALITYVNGELVILASFYRLTQGNPLASVVATLAEINRQIQEKGIKIGKIIAGTTGSGRYLTGDLVGANEVVNEISAQASGAYALDPAVDTILEIGGQDGKIIILKGGVVIDFDMNKACAAGTGTYLEEVAGKLGLTKETFGEMALSNTRPPVIDGTCTVFAKSAVDHFLAHGVSIEDIAGAVCKAAVENYLQKTAGGRSMGQKISFQGATAFNKGMIAAFETVLDRPIFVSENAHVTGAIGVARLVYLKNPTESKFRGFDKIASLDYSVDTFTCPGTSTCKDGCNVNVFQIEGGQKLYFNDRCGKYSEGQRESKRGALPDLFAEREALLISYVPKVVQPDTRTVGIPRGLMFSEYLPLFATFFAKLGFNVVISDETNKNIIQAGLECTAGEPCFPLKTAHGHVMNLLGKSGIDIIFVPRVISAEQPDDIFDKAQTCPYLQAAPEQIGLACKIHERHDITYLTPSLHFQQGEKRIKNTFVVLARQLGKSTREANLAFSEGMRKLADFRGLLREIGRRTLADLGPNGKAFVIIGRPYNLYDPAVNMKVVSQILNMGVLAIPQDYLPLEDADMDNWSFVYSRQIQKKLAAGQIIRQDPRLRGVVLSYFGCGPDSFANLFFEEELGRNCYIMQIDEHTGEAGVITRMEAFYETTTYNVAEPKAPFVFREKAMSALAGRTIWVPGVNHTADALAAVMRSHGVHGEVLRRSPDQGLSLARREVLTDVCLPSLTTIEDMLYRINQPDFNPAKEAFFMGNAGGPCRFGMYAALMRQVLDKLGHHDVEIATLGIKTAHGGLGMDFAITGWNAILTSDLLFKMMLRIRPYELEKGQAERAFKIYMDHLCKLVPNQRAKMRLGNILDLSDYQELLYRASQDFASINTTERHRPLVGVVGEFYVRGEDRANQDVLLALEALGAETWLAPVSEFFSYANYISMVHLGDQRLSGAGNLKTSWAETKRWVNNKLIVRSEHILFKSCGSILNGYADIGSAEIVKLGREYIHHDFGGEAICSVGKAINLAQSGIVSGILNLIPFNCMPGNVAAAMSQEIQEQYGIPVLTLAYNGYAESRRGDMLAAFMARVKDRFERASRPLPQIEEKVLENN